MPEPEPTEHVVAVKRDAGRVTVHGYRLGLWERATGEGRTDCGRLPDWRFRKWLWVEFRTLNPERVVLCKRCWKES